MVRSRRTEGADYGSFPPNLAQYTCSLLLIERTDRILLEDLTERMLLAPDVVLRRGRVLYLGASHSGIGPEIMGRCVSGTGAGDAFAFLYGLETELDSQLKKPKIRRFASGALVGAGLHGHAPSVVCSAYTPSSSSK